MSTEDVSLGALLASYENDGKTRSVIFDTLASITIVVALWNLWHSSDCERDAEQDRYKDTASLIMALVAIFFLVFRQWIDPERHPDNFHIALIMMCAMLLGIGSWNIQSYEKQEDKTTQDRLLFALGGIFPVTVGTVSAVGWVLARLSNHEQAQPATAAAQDAAAAQAKAAAEAGTQLPKWTTPPLPLDNPPRPIWTTPPRPLDNPPRPCEL